MGKRNNLKQINRAYHSRIKGMLKGDNEREIFASLSAGKNTYLRYDRLQSSSFDVSWIEMIEGVIFDLGEIIANPKMNTKQEGVLTPVELARKTNAQSVQHLASHTQYIKEIDDYGNVIPSKIMNIVSDDDLHTYENRFIATLVRRLVLFIEKRYEIVSEFAELRNEEVLMFKNKSIVNGAEVEIETKIKVSYKSDDETAIKSNDYVKRIAELRNYILYFYNSSFMKQLKTERDVRNPILQTNIIRKNPKYHHCYEVYRFIETYDKLGVNYKVDENFALFNADELDELNHTLFANYVTLKGKDLTKNHKDISHIYKPRILTSLDDEAFIYGDLLNGPISFVRTDEKYQQYLNSKIKKDLPIHPTKKEKEYYADEYEDKRQNKEDQKQKDDLLKRKNKEIKQFEKKVEKILEEREEARQNWENMEKEIIRNEENARLTDARNAIISASLNDYDNVENDLKQKEEEKELNDLKERIANTKVVEMSHPHSKPVTYEQAVNQIWPQAKKAPSLRVPTKEEKEAAKAKAKEEKLAAKQAKQEKAKPQEIKPVVVEMSHSYSEPVTYEQAVEQIWPNIKDAPSYRVAIQDEQVNEEIIEEQPSNQPAEEAVVNNESVQEQPKEVKATKQPLIQQGMSFEDAANEIWPQLKGVTGALIKIKKAPAKKQPVSKKKQDTQKKESKAAQPVAVEMSHPYSEPVTYEEAVEQIWPNIKDAPTLRVAPKEETKKQPSKNVNKQKEANPTKVEQKAVKEAKKAKKVAPTKVEEVKQEEKASETIKQEPVKARKEKKEAKVNKQPVEKVAPVKEPVKQEPKKEEKAPNRTPKSEEKPREKIPGKFIVKTNHGYYVGPNKYSVYKDDAKVFDDFNLANDIKKAQGGKVVKL